MVTREGRLHEIQETCRMMVPLTYLEIMGCYPRTPHWALMRIK